MERYFLIFLSVLLCCGASLKVHAELDANNVSHSVYFEDPYNLQDHPFGDDGSKFFPITAGLYYKILNVVATSKENHDIVDQDKIASFITASQDDQGNDRYDVVAGQENTVIGYLPYSDATQLTDALPPNDDEHASVTHYVWMSLASVADYNQVNKSASAYYSYDDGKTFWVCIIDDSATTNHETITENKKDGLTTGSQAEHTTTVQDHPSVDTQNIINNWMEWIIDWITRADLAMITLLWAVWTNLNQVFIEFFRWMGWMGWIDWIVWISYLCLAILGLV